MQVFSYLWAVDLVSRIGRIVRGVAGRNLHNVKLRVSSEEHKDAGYLVKERRYGSFRRSMTLPESIDEGKIKANFSDGLLEVSVEGAGTQVQGGLSRSRLKAKSESPRNLCSSWCIQVDGLSPPDH